MTEQEWLVATDPRPMLECVRIKASDRKLRLFAVACCWPLWPWLTEANSQKAVLTAEKFADGLVSKRTLALARASLKPEFRNQQRLRLRTTILEETRNWHRATAESTRWACSWDAARKALRVDARDAAQTTTLASWGALYFSNSTGEGTTWPQARARLACLARDIFGNPFCPVLMDPTWRTGDVVALAQTVYDERSSTTGEMDQARLTILADALEDAGCQAASVLGHLREPGVHVRGCCLVDLLLGKK